MNPSLIPYIVGWAALALVVLAMAVYRYRLVRHEDSTLDLLENSTVASHQAKVFKKADVIERWGKVLTLIVVAYGLVLTSAYLYHMWLVTYQMPR